MFYEQRDDLPLFSFLPLRGLRCVLLSRVCARARAVKALSLDPFFLHCKTSVYRLVRGLAGVSKHKTSSSAPAPAFRSPLLLPASSAFRILADFFYFVRSRFLAFARASVVGRWFAQVDELI